MKKSKRTINQVRFFLSDEEEAAYTAFLSKFAGKKGPYAKNLLLKRITPYLRNTTPHASPEEDGQADPEKVRP